MTRKNVGFMSLSDLQEIIRELEKEYDEPPRKKFRRLEIIKRNTINLDQAEQILIDKFSTITLSDDEDNITQIYLKLVRQNGNMIWKVPRNRRNERIYLEAVKQNSEVLIHIPAEDKTEDICIAAVRKNGYMLDSVPDKWRTGKLCLIAVKQDGYALISVPERLKTVEICTAAIKQNKDATKDVPQKVWKVICSKFVEKFEV